MINGNSLHYISSGMSHTRINSVKDPKTIEWIKSAVRKTSNENYQVGFLYNAYKEKSLGVLFDRHYRDALCDIHADSGGLQMITLGHSITPELKKQIYEHQSKYSTIAMSFDEIPVTSSGVIDFANRRFNTHLVEEKAIASGKNLVDQLLLFANNKTKAKPLLIAQGNCMETYCRWVDIVQKQIPAELLPMLGGIALAGASMGSGDLENVRTAFYFTQLDLKFECKQVHLLGVGSLSRFVPTMVFMKSGLYKDLIISFDSTTHTACVSRNEYYDSHGRHHFLGKTYHPSVYGKLFDYYKFFDSPFVDSRELFENLAGGPTYKDLLAAGRPAEDIHKFLASKFGLFMVSAKNTLDLFVDYLNDKNITDLTRDEMIVPMQCLKEVKTLQDYKVWEKHFAGVIKSNAVPTADQSTLEDLF